jgi:hypothetical protein
MLMLVPIWFQAARMFLALERMLSGYSFRLIVFDFLCFFSTFSKPGWFREQVEYHGGSFLCQSTELKTRKGTIV